MASQLAIIDALEVELRHVRETRAQLEAKSKAAWYAPGARMFSPLEELWKHQRNMIKCATPTTLVVAQNLALSACVLFQWQKEVR